MDPLALLKPPSKNQVEPGGEGVTVAGTLGPWKAIEERRRLYHRLGQLVEERFGGEFMYPKSLKK